MRHHELIQVIENTLRTAEQQTGELRILESLPERTILVRSAPLRGGSGGAAGAIVVLQDVSELRRVDEIRRDFVANVSHELKTPVTAIRGLVETLIEDDAMPADKSRQFMVRIRDQGHPQTGRPDHALPFRGIGQAPAGDSAFPG